jgi:hypothetical protein
MVGQARLTQVCGLLNAEGVRYVVVGGFAVALHGAVRTTKDIDILIEPTVENAKRALDALGALPWGLSRELDPVVVARKVITIVGDDPRVDILTLAWSVRYADAAPKAITVEVDDVVIPFADLDTLIRSKRTGRFQDQADVEVLEQIKHLGP